MADLTILKNSLEELEALFIHKQDSSENFRVAVAEISKKSGCSRKAITSLVNASVNGRKEQAQEEAQETADLIGAIIDG